MTDRTAFDNFLRPASVAIIGASPQRGIPRNTVLRVLQRHGFAGRIYPVSPSHAEVEGLQAYSSVAALPEVPDVALVITPAATVPGVITECGIKGIRNAIVFSSGFEEVEGGRELARQLADAARQHDVTVLGPNGQGVWSVRHKAMLTFSPSLMRHESIQHTPIAVISQSGALAGAIGNSLQTNGMGVSYIVSVGNETCLDVVDALSSIVEQDDVRVVALYIEGLDAAARLLVIADRARDRDVQIVALKAGRSTVGQQATASHTGKIASSHAVYVNLMTQAGIIVVDSLAQLLAAVEALAFLGHPRVSGDPLGGVAVLSASGGAGALMADHSADAGIPMAEFGAEAAKMLDAILPDIARKANPIDVSGQINNRPQMFGECGLAVVADPRTEAIVVQFSSSGRRYLDENANTFKAMAGEVPVLVSFVGELPDRELRRDFRAAGVQLCSDPSVAIHALSLLYRRQRAKSLPRRPQRPLPAAQPAPADWAATMAFCNDSGLTPARWVVLGPADRAADACAALAFPLVVKVLPSESDHKTELGLVKLRVGSHAEVETLAADFRARLGKPAAGILVQEMVGDGVEVVLSCRRQTDFGPVLSIGSGGVAIELYRDIVSLALPTSAEHVRVALQALKLWTLLRGFRGKPRADIEALADAAVRFSDRFLASLDLQEFEVNPVIVRPRGEGLRAVDALVTLDTPG